MPRPLKPLNPFGSWPALFGAALRQLRLAFCSTPSMSQADLGKRIGYSRAMVSAIERSALRPDEKFVEACERELGAGGVLRAMYPRVNANWDDWARLGIGSPIHSLPPAEFSSDPADPADFTEAAFLEEISDGRAEPLDLPVTSIAAASAQELWIQLRERPSVSAASTPTLVLRCSYPVPCDASITSTSCLMAGSHLLSTEN